MEPRQEYLPVHLPDGTTMHVEATMLGGNENVAMTGFSFADVAETITSISGAVMAAIQKVQPKKATVEFGLEIAAESGKLTTLLVKGSGKANLKIVLEWSA